MKNHFNYISLFLPQAKELPLPPVIDNAAVLLFLGDSVTTDHISPAGSIARNSPAARYLGSKGLVEIESCLTGLKKCFFHFVVLLLENLTRMVLGEVMMM